MSFDHITKDEELKEKKVLVRLKTFLGSIFTRKPHYIYFNTDNPLTFYYAELDEEDFEKTNRLGINIRYKPTADDAIHKVVFKTDEIPKLLMKFLNNPKGIICVSMREANPFLGKLILKKPPTVDFEKTHSASDLFTISILEKLFSHVDVEPTKTTEIEDFLLDKSDIAFKHFDIDDKKEIIVPMLDGHNTVACCEFYKKIKVDYTIKINLFKDLGIYRTSFVNDNELFTATSIMPYAIWYPSKRKI